MNNNNQFNYNPRGNAPRGNAPRGNAPRGNNDDQFRDAFVDAPFNNNENVPLAYIVFDRDVQPLDDFMVLQDLFANGFFNQDEINYNLDYNYRRRHNRENEDDVFRRILDQSLQEYEAKTNPLKEDSKKKIQTEKATGEHTSDMCLICQDAYACDEEMSRLPCKHLFHSSCVSTWFQSQSTCPCCRVKIE